MNDALSMAAPSTSAANQTWHEAVRRRAAQLFFVSLLAALSTGVATSASLRLRDVNATSMDAAMFAYETIGTSISASLIGTMRLIGLQDQAAFVQENVLSYLEIPYQICAFAGAYGTSASVELMSQVVAGLTLQH